MVDVPIQTGDVVVLISGGPRMTVVHIEEKIFKAGKIFIQIAHCQWFANDILQSDEFRSDTLTRLERTHVPDLSNYEDDETERPGEAIA